MALLSAHGLGDGLLFMIISHHLSQEYEKVVLFNSNLLPLADWFPGKFIESSPPPIDKLSSFDLIIASDHLSHPVPSSIISLTLQEKQYDKKKTMVQNLHPNLWL